MSLFNKKKDTDYAYAVARVRSNELSLLTEADTEQLIEAEQALDTEALVAEAIANTESVYV